jgi:hypothetical protein
LRDGHLADGDGVDVWWHCHRRLAHHVLVVRLALLSQTHHWSVVWAYTHGIANIICSWLLAQGVL